VLAALAVNGSSGPAPVSLSDDAAVHGLCPVLISRRDVSGGVACHGTDLGRGQFDPGRGDIVLQV
jgi:hypothetical protein